MQAKASLFVLWQSLVVSSYRSFFNALAARKRYRIALVSPEKFLELGMQDVACAPFAPPFKSGNRDYPCFVLPTLRPKIQVVWFKGLGRAMKQFFQGQNAPRVFVCMAEPYSVTALLAWITARLCLGRHVIFITFTLQNIRKDFVFPLRWLQNFIFKQSTSILVLGKEQEDVLRAQGYHGAIIPFPLWYDSTLFSLGPSQAPRTLTIGFAGGLTEAKGILDFLEAAERVAKDQPIAIKIAGGGALENMVRQACERLRNQHVDIHCVGSLPAEAMPDFYRSIDIFVIPSRTMPNWKEQFGRVIVEARACGVVALGSNSGAIPEVIADDTRIFRERDAKDMERVIRLWVDRLHEPSARATIRSVEADTARMYSETALAERFERHIEDLLDRRENTGSDI